MKVLIVPAFGPCSVRVLEHPLEDLQKIVGGDIEIVAPMELRDHPRIRMIVNADFLNLGLPFNLFASYLYGYGTHRDPILGTAVFAYQGVVDGEPDLVGLPYEELRYLNILLSRANR